MYEELDELASVIHFFKRYLNFSDAQAPFQLKTANNRELILIASGMSKPPYNSFFLQDNHDNEEFVFNLKQGLGEAWIQDYMLQKNVSNAKYLYFFDHWYSPDQTANYARRRARDMYAFLRDSVRKAGVEKGRARTAMLVGMGLLCSCAVNGCCGIRAIYLKLRAGGELERFALFSGKSRLDGGCKGEGLPKKLECQVWTGQHKAFWTPR